MLHFLKKHWIVCIIIVIVLYFVIGAIAPFVHYKEVKEKAALSLTDETLFGNSQTIDRAMLVETNLSAWEERLRLMNQAQERIIMSTFDMRDGESTKDILAILLDKAEQGVDVKILVDGFSGLIRMEGNEVFYALSAHPNVELKVYNRMNFLTPWKTQGRMHDKYIIVDDLAYMLGGRNTFDYFIGEYETDNRSYDREVLIYNTGHGTSVGEKSSLYEVENYFNHVWNLGVCTYFHDDEKLLGSEKVKEQTSMLHERAARLKEEFSSLFTAPDYKKMTYDTQGIHLLHNPTGIYGKEPDVFYQLTELMKQAKKQVVIHTPYAVLNNYMLETLSQVAQAVPDTRLLINSVENGDNFFASSDYMYNKQKVIDTGMQIFEYDGGNSYHGKSVTIDNDISVVGSYNFDLRSTYMDTELMLVIKSEGLTKELSGYMSGLEKYARKVITKTAYETPDYLEIASVSAWKRGLWHIVGFIMQPFRFVI